MPNLDAINAGISAAQQGVAAAMTELDDSDDQGTADCGQALYDAMALLRHAARAARDIGHGWDDVASDD